MKRYFGWLIITLVVVLSSGAAYSQDKIKERIVNGMIPSEWGSLHGVTAYGDGARLFFMDSKGTIRTVLLNLNTFDKSAPRLEKAFVVNRSK
jgi:hypothetical protein